MTSSWGDLWSPKGDLGILVEGLGSLGGPLGLPFGRVCWLLGGRWDALSPLLGVLGGPLGPLGALGALTGSPEIILADSCSEINGSKGDPWGTLEVPWGPLEALEVITWTPKLLLADSCNEVQVFFDRDLGGPWKQRRALTRDPKLISAYSCVKSMVLRGREWV